MVTWIVIAVVGGLAYFQLPGAFDRFFSHTPFRGLTNRACRQICRDHRVPQDVPGLSLPLALMIAHASYPKGRLGIPEWDARLSRLPPPIVGPDQASTIAHRYVDFHEMSVDQCLMLQYGRPPMELLDLFLG